MKKRTLLYSLFMTLVMMAISPQGAWAIGGSGTSSSPYTIANASDLVAFASKVNGSEQGAYAKLTADITLTSAWTAMGTSSKPYTGIFDGQGHTISGFSMEGYTKVNAGFFGYVKDATIKNFTLNGTMTSSTQITSGENDCSGAVVGRAMGSSTIQDIVSNVNITLTKAQKHLGGVVGAIEGSTVVKGCTYTGTLDAGPSTDCIGGIVGFAPASCSGSIFYCFFNGTLSSSSSTPTMGGILGYTNDESNNFSGVHDCYSCGTFSFGASDYKYVNAIVGRIRNRATTTINNTYHSGIATRACNTDGPSIPASNKAITISVTAGSNGTVSHSYVNPTTSAPTQLQVVATPDEHYYFSSWSDYGVQTHNVGLTANVDLTATFVHNPIIRGGPYIIGTGTVSGIGEYSYNSKAIITAIPNNGYEFVKWSDGYTNPSRTITVTQDKYYTAYFEPITYEISLNVADGQSHMGTVTGSGIFNYNSLQTIKATPKEHYHFVEWSDGNKNASRSITVTGSATYTATFAIDQYKISVLVASSQRNMGTVSEGGDFDYNSQQTITATPNTGYKFVKWDDDNTDASRTITVTQNKYYTAYFEPITYEISLNVADGQSHMGTVTGEGKYNYNSHPNIRAIPNTGYHFVQWSDGSTYATSSVTVTGDATYTATFAPNQYTIIVKDSDYGTVTGGGTYDYGTQQTITATPKEHYHFVQWNDGDTNASRTITVNGNASYTATFAPKAKAVLNNGTLTFYYDDKDHDGVTYQLNTGTYKPEWFDSSSTSISTVVFDASFAVARPTSCHEWFYNCINLTSIIGLEHLNTSEVTSMGSMFYDCSALKSLTIGNFDMQKVTNAVNMFYGCPALNTLTMKSIPFLADGTFNTQFSGDGKTVTLTLTDNSYIYTGANNLPAVTSATFNREIVADGGMYSFIVPFDIPAGQAAELGKFYQYSGHDPEVRKVYFDDIAEVSDGVVKANTAYFFKPAKDITSFTVNNPSIPRTLTIPDPEYPSVPGLYGTYSEIEVPVGAYGYAMQGAESTFVRAGYGNVLRPYRAYLWLGSGAYMAKALAFFGDYDDITGINNIETDTDLDMSKPIYTLSGQRIMTPKKGEIYIQNGKKVIKK